ncbi:hypothetical protein LV89_01298 [Arcicella aurantiaca]|uniref:Uncharacterized protein n=1 Tax=Arcicella aurantiaca TaxID=591202 RepID=A0A316EAR7_9BACT|nr:hypothetical protein [Arcicella aurantiaca]PWK27891.1 hypothetical protein LV89_01298 [Arcicella aurantiaca]
MKKINILLLSFIIFTACQKNKVAEQQADSVKVESIAKVDTMAKSVNADSSDIAKKWLVSTIEDAFKNNMGEYDKFCTKKYAEYKSDATGVGMDGGLTEKAFKKKWSKDYDTKYSGMGIGFMINAQDWNTIKVTDVQLKNKLENGGYFFKIVVEDIEAKAKNNREVKVIRSSKSFLIDDVLEYN